MNDQMKMRADYFRLMNMNGASHVYRESVRLGLLDSITENPRTVADIAVSCGTLEGPTALLLDVLDTLGIVQSTDQVFSLTPLAGMLISGGYRELGDLYWSHLPDFLKTGKPMAAMDSVTHSEEHYQKQAAALGWMLAPAAEAAAQHLRPRDSSSSMSIIDIGAGSAIWSLTIARQDSESTVTAVDWPAVLQIAEATARQFGMDNRLITCPGNYHEVELPADSYDLAILGNVTHLEPPEGNRSLFEKVRVSLKNSGHIVIMDIFPGQSEGDINRTLYSLGLALRTEMGHVYSPRSLDTLLNDTGYAAATLINLDVPPYAVGMLVAQKR